MLEKKKLALAILATGDELIQGDILNRNAQSFAKICVDHQLALGMQLVVADNLSDLVAAFRFLNETHQFVLTTGGLGPTSDDITRLAVAQALDVELEFHEGSWQRLCSHLQKYNVDITENNKQQCLFFKGATLLPNKNGTADGCVYTHKDGVVVMLPGPPRECLPLFKQYVLPILSKKIKHNIQKKNWMLMGLGESMAATLLEPLLESCPLQVAYRVSYPYLEIKFFSEDVKSLAELAQKFEQVFESYIVARGRTKASDLLLAYINKHDMSLGINDAATKGYIQSQLLNPQTQQKIGFNSEAADITLTIEGLAEYWSQQEVSSTAISITVSGTFDAQWTYSIKMIGHLTLNAAYEWLCWKLHQFLLQNDHS